MVAFNIEALEDYIDDNMQREIAEMENEMESDQSNYLRGCVETAEDILTELRRLRDE